MGKQIRVNKYGKRVYRMGEVPPFRVLFDGVENTSTFRLDLQTKEFWAYQLDDQGALIIDSSDKLLTYSGSFTYLEAIDVATSEVVIRWK